MNPTNGGTFRLVLDGFVLEAAGNANGVTVAAHNTATTWANAEKMHLTDSGAKGIADALLGEGDSGKWFVKAQNGIVEIRLLDDDSYQVRFPTDGWRIDVNALAAGAFGYGLLSLVNGKLRKTTMRRGGGAS